MNSHAITAQTLIDFWFSPDVAKLWFHSTPVFDDELRERYSETYEMARRGELGDWQETAEGALALIILFDQIPLNIFRGQAASFATEARAREVAEKAIARGLDAQLSDKQKVFMYLPYMHSENLADQDTSVDLFTRAGLDENLRFARHHREIVQRFGRFPHRNALLGRTSSEEEIAWLASKESFKG